MTLDPVRRGDELERHLSDRPNDQRRRGFAGRAQRQVVAFGHQVDPAVLQPDVQEHVRVPLLVVGDRIGEGAVGEPHRRGDLQQAARGGAAFADCRLGRLQRVERVAALLEVHGAGLGQAQVTAGAVQQPRVQLALQMRDVFAGHRRGDAQPFGGRHETADLHDFTEHFEAGQGVHLGLVSQGGGGSMIS